MQTPKFTLNDIKKGLRRFYTTGNTAGIQSNHASCLRFILTNLDQAALPNDMDLPGLRLHELKGSRIPLVPDTYTTL